MSDRIPLHVLTGFLGSGKTTLLNRILTHPAWADSAILINEIGAVSIDHLLVDRIESSEDIDIMVLQGGCTCCALRGDMVAALRALYQRRADGLVPPFARVVMETTGLADPAPVLFTLAADPALRHKFEAGVVLATFDAVHGDSQLLRFAESRKQIAVADRIVLTKTDIEAAKTPVNLSAAIRRINPAATIFDAGNTLTPEIVLKAGTDDLSTPSRIYDSYKTEPVSLDIYDRHKQRRESGDFNDRVYETHKHDHAHEGGEENFSAPHEPALIAEMLSDVSSHLVQNSLGNAKEAVAEHAPHIDSVSITIDRPLEWSPFAVWLTLLLHAHGEKMLRFKALLDIVGWPGPVALNGIHHMIHPPIHLAKWPDGPRISRLVFIAERLRMERIEPSLHAFLAGRFQA